MDRSPGGLADLPQAVRARLDALLDALRAKLGDDLDSVLGFGSAARGGYRAGESDVDLMIVLRRDPQAHLEAIGPALQLARFSARIEAMIVARDEIPRSADCFPLLYADIAGCSFALHGTSPFAGMKIESEHTRLRIEQELREARIRLRRVVTDMAGTPAFGRAIERKLKQLRGPLFALLGLRGHRQPDQFEAVFDGMAKLYGLDLAPLTHAREVPGPAYAALVQLLDRALADVDVRGAVPAGGSS